MARQFRLRLEHRSARSRLRHERVAAADVLGWALTFFILAIIAEYFGFFGLAGVAASIAKGLFLIFLVLLVVSFIGRALRGRSVM